MSPMFSSYGSPGGDSRNDRSVVRDKVLVKSQAGNETIHPREPGHAEVEPGPQFLSCLSYMQTNAQRGFFKRAPDLEPTPRTQL